MDVLVHLAPEQRVDLPVHFVLEQVLRHGNVMNRQKIRMEITHKVNDEWYREECGDGRREYSTSTEREGSHSRECWIGLHQSRPQVELGSLTTPWYILRELYNEACEDDLRAAARRTWRP